MYKTPELTQMAKVLAEELAGRGVQLKHKKAKTTVGIGPDYARSRARRRGHRNHPVPRVDGRAPTRCLLRFAQALRWKRRTEAARWSTRCTSSLDRRTRRS